MNPGTAAARDIDPDVWDLKAVRALLSRVYREHKRGDNLGCHCAVMALYRHLRLVRLIVPQHPLWTVNPYQRCNFRCTYCSVNAQGTAVPVLTGDALRRRLRLELQIVPAKHHTALSSMCDAYVPSEAQLGIARLSIEELIAAGRCVHVVTKGTTVLRDADLLRRARCGKVEVSLCTLDEERANRLEPGAPSPAERLALVRRLADEGVDVGVMVAPWIPGVTKVAAVLGAVGPERRITVSPLKCNAEGARVKLAGRVYTQPTVNRRYREERERFRGATSLRWEAPWQFDDHYTSRYLPLTFEKIDGLIRSPEPAPTPRQRVGPPPPARGSRQDLLLSTRGRHSQRARPVRLAYVEDGDRWVVVASNGGGGHDPAWLRNLRADPRATVQVGQTRTTVQARTATRAEQLRLWPMLEVRRARRSVVILERR